MEPEGVLIEDYRGPLLAQMRSTSAGSVTAIVAAAPTALEAPHYFTRTIIPAAQQRTWPRWVQLLGKYLRTALYVLLAPLRWYFTPLQSADDILRNAVRCAVWLLVPFLLCLAAIYKGTHSGTAWVVFSCQFAAVVSGLLTMIMIPVAGFLSIVVLQDSAASDKPLLARLLSLVGLATGVMAVYLALSTILNALD